MHQTKEIENSVTVEVCPQVKTHQNVQDAKWSSRGSIPHFNAPGRIQHLVISLEDSLPREVLQHYQRLPENSEGKRPSIGPLLDEGRGICLLKNPKAAALVQESLLFGHPDRYWLFAWVVMPNHVHVLFRQNAQWSLGKIVSGWKRHTTKYLRTMPEAATYQRKDGRFRIWRPDYWDRYVRNSMEFEKLKQYIEANPVKAGLVNEPKLWKWSSAYLGNLP